jgi:hypothetical protein
MTEYNHGHFRRSQHLHADGTYVMVVILKVLIVHDGFVVCSETQSQALFEIVTLKQFEQEFVDQFPSWVVHGVVRLQEKVEP